MNIWDFVILGVVICSVILAALNMRRNKKNGKCPGGCDCCGAAGACRNSKSRSQ